MKTLWIGIVGMAGMMLIGTPEAMAGGRRYHCNNNLRKVTQAVKKVHTIAAPRHYVTWRTNLRMAPPPPKVKPHHRPRRVQPPPPPPRHERKKGMAIRPRR